MTTLSRARSERGFSMFLVVVALLLTSMFAAAAYAAASGDLPISGMSKDRKSAYAAAEAGLNFYQTHVNQDPDYWTHCDNVPKPGPTEVNPVNPVWDGVTARRWRNVAGSDARYTIEVLPANGAAKCKDGDQTTVLDQKTGTFRIRITGQPRAGSSLHRSIVATFKRKSFLDYLWFTDFEDQDPQAFATQSERTYADNNCKTKYRPARAGLGCKEIQWITGDGIAGPVHSNDSLLICGSPTFGRDLPYNDPIESMQTVGKVADSGCTDATNIKGRWKTGADQLTPPTDDQPLKDIAQPPDGLYYQGRTIIRLHGTTMDVRKANGTVDTNVSFPTNGVIFVDNLPACNLVYPSSVTYAEDDSACGNVYVSGSYSSKSLTIAAANDVIIAPTSGASLNWSSWDEGITLQSGSDGVLGLIANRFVRVGHKVNRGGSCTNYSSAANNADLEVDAAILALQHSWIVDNYDCGRLGKLTVKGAIAQEYRGPVGTGGHGTGFLKDYNYDDRLRYRSPPYFLSPLAAQWTAIRVNEQLPAQAGTD